jgi:hypothetical protein
VQDYDALVDGYDLGTNRAILVRQHIENAADGRRNPAIRTIRDDPEQLSCSIAALGRYNAEFGQVSAQGMLNTVRRRTSNCRAWCSINPSS